MTTVEVVTSATFVGASYSTSPNSPLSSAAASTVWMPSSVIVCTWSVGSSGPGKMAIWAPGVYTSPSPEIRTAGVCWNVISGVVNPPSSAYDTITSSDPVGCSSAPSVDGTPGRLTLGSGAPSSTESSPQAASPTATAATRTSAGISRFVMGV